MDFTALKDWWWLLLAIIAFTTGFVRYTIKIHEAVEGLKRVAEHDKKLAVITEQYKSIEEDTAELKGGMTDLAAALDKHVAEQKDELKAINVALYSILDILKKTDAGAEAAQLKLREHTLGK
ncbi:MAG: hypothetical protein AB9880_03660 [Christensenellales bacterium]